MRPVTLSASRADRRGGPPRRSGATTVDLWAGSLLPAPGPGPGGISIHGAAASTTVTGFPPVAHGGAPLPGRAGPVSPSRAAQGGGGGGRHGRSVGPRGSPGPDEWPSRPGWPGRVATLEAVWPEWGGAAAATPEPLGAIRGGGAAALRVRALSRSPEPKRLPAATLTRMVPADSRAAGRGSRAAPDPVLLLPPAGPGMRGQKLVSAPPPASAGASPPPPHRRGGGDGGGGRESMSPQRSALAGRSRQWDGGGGGGGGAGAGGAGGTGGGGGVGGGGPGGCPGLGVGPLWSPVEARRLPALWGRVQLFPRP
jgi:hypothetical protein